MSPHLLTVVGTEFTDTVSLGSGLTITKQSIGVASSSQGFAGVDGIIGYVHIEDFLCKLAEHIVGLAPLI